MKCSRIDRTTWREPPSLMGRFQSSSVTRQLLFYLTQCSPWSRLSRLARHSRYSNRSTRIARRVRILFYGHLWLGPLRPKSSQSNYASQVPLDRRDCEAIRFQRCRDVDSPDCSALNALLPNLNSFAGHCEAGPGGHRKRSCDLRRSDPIAIKAQIAWHAGNYREGVVAGHEIATWKRTQYGPLLAKERLPNFRALLEHDIDALVLMRLNPECTTVEKLSKSGRGLSPEHLSEIRRL